MIRSGAHSGRFLQTRSSALALVAAGSAVLSLASACASSPVGEQPTEEASASQMSADSSSDSPPPSSPDPTTSAAGSSKTQLCETKNLEVKVANDQGAAGSQLFDLVFVNNGTDPCNLRGYPGVSMVTDNNGTQLGASAEREKQVDAPLVTLTPGDSALAPVRISKVGKLDPQECRPSSADGIRVYPPDETHSVYLPMDNLEGCSGKPRYMSVQPVHPAE